MVIVSGNVEPGPYDESRSTRSSWTTSSSANPNQRSKLKRSAIRRRLSSQEKANGGTPDADRPCFSRRDAAGRTPAGQGRSRASEASVGAAERARARGRYGQAASARDGSGQPGGSPGRANAGGAADDVDDVDGRRRPVGYRRAGGGPLRSDRHARRVHPARLRAAAPVPARHHSRDRRRTDHREDRRLAAESERDQRPHHRRDRRTDDQRDRRGDAPQVRQRPARARAARRRPSGADERGSHQRPGAIQDSRPRPGDVPTSSQRSAARS